MQWQRYRVRMSADDNKETEFYANHSKAFYVGLPVVVAIVSGVVGVLYLPEDWSAFRRLAGGVFGGLWCAYCVFMWHYIFYAERGEEE